ncbi:NfeD family protein [Paenibacillus sp. NPDC058174]|uniref:NfeD family protein n=1 Tax=Paenibacillus sp. NPDC058174 TaxID=3346366 RepID=UPI0036DA8A20
MEALFWGCLIFGVLFAIISVIFGDWISMALDGVLDFLSLDGYPWMQPMSLVGGITAFGGAGLLLTDHTSMNNGLITIIALLIAIIIAGGVYFVYVKPMEQSENSLAVSEQEFSGKLAEVLVPIPSKGYGEVMLKAGAGHTNQIAASFDGEPIPEGAQVVVVEVRDSTLYVAKVDLQTK